MQPPPPESAPPASWRPPPNGTARVQRGLLLAGLFALVSLGFALAPYLSLVAIGAACSSCAPTRGPRRRPRTGCGAAAAVVARSARRDHVPVVPARCDRSARSTALMPWSAALAFLVGLGLLLFRPPVEGSLIAMGGVLGVLPVVGPGRPAGPCSTRSLILSATRVTWVGWVGVAVVPATAASAPTRCSTADFPG